MSDFPGRPAYEPEDRGGAHADGEGWGSPVPAEYGSLFALEPPVARTTESGPGILRRFQSGLREPLSTDEVSAPAFDDHLVTEVPIHEDPPRHVESPVRVARGQSRGRSRSRATLRHVDVKSVAKVSLVFFLLVLVVIVVASVLLWFAADAFGTLPSIEKSVRTLFSLKSFKLHPGAVAMYTSAAGVVIAIAGTLASILLALIYNLIADAVGGLRVDLDSFGSE